MNLFILDKNVTRCAKALGDKHIVKMTLETTQILSTCVWQMGYGSWLTSQIYKPTHENHPCVVWARSCEANYNYMLSTLKAQLREYKWRRKRDHRCSDLLDHFDHVFWASNYRGKKRQGLEVPKITRPPLVMPQGFVVRGGIGMDSVVDSYRNYYFDKWKRGMVKYRWRREMPDWLQEMTTKEK